MKHATIKITGKVQGVFFRASTKKEADLLGIFGYVENINDGSIFIEAEGEEKILKKFIAWCKRGPENAKVETIDVQYGDELKNFSFFEIKR